MLNLLIRWQIADERFSAPDFQRLIEFMIADCDSTAILNYIEIEHTQYVFQCLVFWLFARNSHQIEFNLISFSINATITQNNMSNGNFLAMLKNPSNWFCLWSLFLPHHSIHTWDCSVAIKKNRKFFHTKCLRRNFFTTVPFQTELVFAHHYSLFFSLFAR